MTYGERIDQIQKLKSKQVVSLDLGMYTCKNILDPKTYLAYKNTWDLKYLHEDLEKLFTLMHENEK